MKHIPVLKNEVLKYLIPEKVDENFIFIDCTLGAGGHSKAILEKSQARVIGIDQDENALELAKKNLAKYKDRITFIKNNFKNYPDVLKTQKVKSVNAVLIDLGISSMQIDDLNRGFSFKNPKAKLDMRMDKSQVLSAYHVINKYSEKELTDVFRNSGERFYKRIIKNIIDLRKNQEITSIGDLLEILEKSIPEKFKHKRIHFATNTFRALRIEVNSELENIKIAIPDIIESLKKDGRLGIITFHSTEDKLVKDLFNDYINPCKCPKNLPCVCGKQPELKKVAKLMPGDEEISSNLRSRSAILRIVEKV